MFVPKRIIFTKNTLNYEIGKRVYEKFKENKNVQIIKVNSNRVKEYINGDNLKEFYNEGKETLVLGVKGRGKFQSCKPSAHYQLPLVSGCIGKCQYCYLNTNLGDKPYLKVNVNIEDILDRAKEYIEERKPDTTIFEGSATSDPIPVEPYTRSLERAIEFFAKEDKARFRFVTKYPFVDSLLNLDHRGKTEIRFTLNTQRVIDMYEMKTGSSKKRIEASIKLIEAKYPVGFIIAPVFIYDNWKEDYKKLLLDLAEALRDKGAKQLTFEVISHRYTTRAKNIINEVFEDNKLPMNDEERTYKYGQFGYGKFVYTKEEINEIKLFFTKEIEGLFKDSEIKYII